MTPEQTLAFVNALNGIQKYVPPIAFAEVAGSPIASTLVAIAQGQVTCVITPVEAPAPKVAVKAKG
jgi:hypothetical protein